jgi:HEAT repeat protein
MQQVVEGNIEELITKLKTGTAPSRYTAANKLGKLGDKAAVNHLLLSLDDEDAKVADNVIFALGELGDQKAVPPLIKVLNHSKSDRLRKSAAKALGLLGSKEAVDSLISALNDPDFKVRKSAARSLGQLGDKKAIPALKKAMQDPDFTVDKYVDDALDRLEGL